MNSRSEDLLYFLLWGAETLSRPTFHNLTESFEGWVYRHDLSRRINRLKDRRLIEDKSDGTVGAIYRLTEAGRIAALAGDDPEVRWNRPWDGQWRLILFDLPEQQNASRVRLRRYLKSRRFGNLQKSVWITPDDLDPHLRALAQEGQDVETLVTLLAKSGSGETNAAIVGGSWDFDRINRLYAAELELLQGWPKRKGGKLGYKAALLQWARREKEAWGAATRTDPLLPSRLLPPGYLGRKAWEMRNLVFRQAGEARAD